MKIFFLRLLFFFYPPFFGAGIRIKRIAANFHSMRVELPLTWWNRNYVGTQFGGSIYAMTDPFCMFMLMMILGGEYYVWDKAANIDFIKPGKRRLIAEFLWTPGEVEHIRKQTENGEKFLIDKEVQIHDSEGLLVAKVIKTLYIRKKEH